MRYFTALLSVIQSGTNSVYSAIVTFTTSRIGWFINKIINFLWYLATNIFGVLHFGFTIMWIALRLIIAAVVPGVTGYLGIIAY